MKNVFNNKTMGIVAVKMMFFLFAVVVIWCAFFTGRAYAAIKNPDMLYRAKCASCHRVYPPKDYTYKKFQEQIAKYGKALSDDERGAISEYLKANAKHE